MQSDKSCQLCNVPFCTICDSTNSSICTTCQDGFDLSTDKLSCKSKLVCNVEHCDVCDSTDSSLCNICAPEYKLLSNKTCHHCSVENCNTCLLTNYTKCSTCATDYVLQSDKSCQHCTVSLCATCDPYDFAKCTKCASQYKLQSDNTCQHCALLNCITCDSTDYKKCSVCPSEFTLQSDKTCQHCTASNCISCLVSNYTKCGICADSYALFNGKCYNPLNCKSYSTSSYCKECNADYCLNSDKTCVSKENCNLGCSPTTPCTQCSVGYGLIEITKTCSKCSSNCASCDKDPIICTKCIDGYGLNSDSNSCEKCTSNCNSCDGKSPADNCNKCSSNYCLNLDKTCVSNTNCIKGCSITTPCTSCAIGFGLSSNTKECINCNNQQCSSCIIPTDESSPICENCINGFKLNTDGTCVPNDFCKDVSTDSPCTECLPGYGLVESDKTCQKCNDANCVSCNDADPTATDSCNKCAPGYGLNLAEDINTCVACVEHCKDNCDGENPLISCTACVDGYLFNSETKRCTACPANCSECSLTKCTVCLSGFILDDTSNTCQPCVKDCLTCTLSTRTTECTECKADYSFDSITKTCVKCNSNNCAKCDGSAPTKCITCNVGFNLTNSGICVCNGSYCTSCSYSDETKLSLCSVCIVGYKLIDNICIACLDGYYPKNDKCLKCSDKCANCVNSSVTCTSCPTNYNLFGSTCYSQCPTSTFASINDKNINTCEYCSKYSKECQICDSTQCLSCSSRSILYNGQCIDDCPNQTFKKDSSCISCIDGCDFCLDDKSCIKCQPGILYNDGTCIDDCAKVTKTKVGDMCLQSTFFTITEDPKEVASSVSKTFLDNPSSINPDALTQVVSMIGANSELGLSIVSNLIESSSSESSNVVDSLISQTLGNLDPKSASSFILSASAGGESASTQILDSASKAILASESPSTDVISNIISNSPELGAKLVTNIFESENTKSSSVITDSIKSTSTTASEYIVATVLKKVSTEGNTKKLDDLAKSLTSDMKPEDFGSNKGYAKASSNIISASYFKKPSSSKRSLTSESALLNFSTDAKESLSKLFLNYVTYCQPNINEKADFIKLFEFKENLDIMSQCGFTNDTAVLKFRSDFIHLLNSIDINYFITNEIVNPILS